MKSVIHPIKKWLGLFEQFPRRRYVVSPLGHAAAGIGCSGLLPVSWTLG
jgi:hypothetical protein